MNENNNNGTTYHTNITSFSNNPVELTLEQWDKIVNKTMEEEFKLPEKWYVLSQGKDTYEKYLQPYLLELNYSWPSWDDRDYYYHFSPEEVVATETVKSGFTEITFEQFIKYVLKEEIMKENNKEIIGWKLKDSYEQYKQVALTICNTTVNWENSLMPYDISIKQTGYISKLEKAGVLELWFEPVLSQKFKVGDWVTVEKYSGYWASLLNKNCPENVKYPLIGQITKMQDDDNSYTGIELCNYGFDLTSLLQKNLIKLATPEEIKTTQISQITINGYKGEFFDNYVKFGCAKIDKDLFVDLDDLGGGIGNRSIEDVTIGKGTFTKEQIKQIAEYYLNKK